MGQYYEALKHAAGTTSVASTPGSVGSFAPSSPDSLHPALPPSAVAAGLSTLGAEGIAEETSEIPAEIPDLATQSDASEAGGAGEPECEG